MRAVWIAYMNIDREGDLLREIGHTEMRRMIDRGIEK